MNKRLWHMFIYMIWKIWITAFKWHPPSWNPSFGSWVIAPGSWVNISQTQFNKNLLYLCVSKNTISQSGCHHMNMNMFIVILCTINHHINKYTREDRGYIKRANGRRQSESQIISKREPIRLWTGRSEVAFVT